MRIVALVLLLAGCASEPPVSVGPVAPVAASDYPSCRDVTVRYGVTCEVR